MLDGLLEALFAPIKASFTRLLQPSTSLPEFRPLLVLALVVVCLARSFFRSVTAIRGGCSQATVESGLCFGAALALASGLVYTVPAESSDIAYGFHVVFGFLATFSSWPLATAYFFYLIAVLVVELLLATSIALITAILPGVLLFMLCNFCIWLAVGVAFAMCAVFQVFCSSVQQRYSSSPPRVPNPANAAQLVHAAQAAAGASQAHRLAVQAAIPVSDKVKALQRVWLHWVATRTDDQVLWLARRLMTATTDPTPSYPVQWHPLPPVQGFDSRYTLWAAECILPHARAEHMLRYDYTQTVLDKLVLFLRHLSGFLLQTLFPLPALHDHFKPLSRELVVGVFFSPFVVIHVPRHPDNWARPVLDAVECVEPATSPALGELLTPAVQILHDTFGPTAMAVDHEPAKQRISAVLEEAATRWRAERADRQLPDVVLHAVLLWKARKEGR